MSRASLPRRLLAAILGVSLLVVLAPSVLARGSSLTVTACLSDPGTIQITMTWSGITADGDGFGAGNHGPNGGGLGFFQPLPATESSGTDSTTFPVDTSNPYDTAGGTLYLGGFDKANVVGSKTIHRGSGWAPC